MAENDLLKALKDYADTDAYPMHMPGHKRNGQFSENGLPLDIDITEIDGFDNLHQPEGILKNLCERIQKLYGSAFSLPLINGSTVGILAGIASVFSFGGSILLARNCHKSLYNAVKLFGLTPYYLVPPVDEMTGIAGSILPEDVENMLKKYPEIQLVVLTSPTYDGVLSDIKSIVKIAHKKNVPVLVDEAHGAHLQFSGMQEYSAVAAGADIVIQSLHKTLPAMTQTAVAHINGNLVSPEAFQKQCAVFESSSPSYVLLSSIASCVATLEAHGTELFAAYQKNLQAFSEKMSGLSNLLVLGKGKDNIQNHAPIFAFDQGKILISTTKTTLHGPKLMDMLRDKFHIECEMASASYALAMTSCCDTKEGFERLENALLQIDKTLTKQATTVKFKATSLPKQVCTPFAAGKKSGTFLPLSQSQNKVALDFLFCYPPGIPLLVPGEEISASLLEEIAVFENAGISVQSGDKKLPEFYSCD